MSWLSKTWDRQWSSSRGGMAVVACQESKCSKGCVCRCRCYWAWCLWCCRPLQIGTQAALNVFRECGIEPGFYCTEEMRNTNKIKVSKAECKVNWRIFKEERSFEPATKTKRIKQKKKREWHVNHEEHFKFLFIHFYEILTDKGGNKLFSNINRSNSTHVLFLNFSAIFQKL